jgi:hypothetical protein
VDIIIIIFILLSTRTLRQARFELGDNNSTCPSSHFSDHMIIFDNTFCGDWAGSVFASGGCGGGPGCEEYVQYNPSFFKESYWRVNFVDVYELLD